MAELDQAYGIVQHLVTKLTVEERLTLETLLTLDGTYLCIAFEIALYKLPPLTKNEVLSSI